MELSEVVMIYFVIGAVMVGGGAIQLTDAGMASFFIQEDANGDLEPTNTTTNELEETDDAISTVVSLTVGGIVLVWDLALGLFNFLNWPVVTLQQANAPPMAVLLLGGGFTSAFYMAIIGLVWRAT